MLSIYAMPGVKEPFPLPAVQGHHSGLPGLPWPPAALCLEGEGVFVLAD